MSYTTLTFRLVAKEVIWTRREKDWSSEMAAERESFSMLILLSQRWRQRAREWSTWSKKSEFLKGRVVSSKEKIGEEIQAERHSLEEEEARMASFGERKEKIL